MNLRQLQTFYWVVRLGTFASAAEHLRTTQSTVSARIHELEIDLGVGLFDRTHRAAKLTPKGKELVTYAERFVALMLEMEERIGVPAPLRRLEQLDSDLVRSLVRRLGHCRPPESEPRTDRDILL